MAVKSVFISKNSYPYFEEIQVKIDWFQGFALSQKRKNELAVHHNFLSKYPSNKVLEISGASLNTLGQKLSAMHLSKQTEQGLTTVESAYQCSRIYYDVEADEYIGPFPEYLFLDGKTSKKLVKSASKGLDSYVYLFDHMKFGSPEFHISLFYDFIYMNALLEKENYSVTKELINGNYNAFTDLATNSRNSQARSAAIFVGLHQACLLDEITDYKRYHELFRVSGLKDPIGDSSYENVQLLEKKGIHLLSPVVEKTLDRDEIIRIYKKYYSHLTNKKKDIFRRPGIYEIPLEDIQSIRLLKSEASFDFLGIRIYFKNGNCLNIPEYLLSEKRIYLLKRIQEILFLKYINKEWISEEEQCHNVIWPWLNEEHMDVLSGLDAKVDMFFQSGA
ncbi:MAG: hypothetical protein IJ137_05745 [Eubacterium sp.]|nr:hypothetical protein [Eubacterium sp.]